MQRSLSLRAFGACGRVVSGAAVLLVAATAWGSASTPTPVHPHARHVATQTVKPVPAKPEIAKKSNAKPTESKPRAAVKPKAKKHEPEPEAQPVIFYRAHGGKSSKDVTPLNAKLSAKPSVKLTPEERASHARAVVANAEAKKIDAKPIAAAVDPNRKPTVEDFLAVASRGSAGGAVESTPVAAEVHAEPKAHAPAPAIVKAAAKIPAKTIAKPEPPVIAVHKMPLPAQSVVRSNDHATAPMVRQRVDGFGAEGAVPETRPEVAAIAPPSVKETVKQEDARDDAALALLKKPTREELAEEAVQPRVIGLYASNGRLIVPAPLRGSHDVLVHQNTMADEEGLDRIQDDADLDRLRAHHLLVDFPESASLHLNPELPANRRCARVWSVKFAADMARAFYAQFHQPLQVNSAARTVSYQRRLERTNGNAAAVDGEGASPHLTGQAIDFGKRGMSAAEIAWMRDYLLPLMQAGKVDVEEEFQQACFHISVYKSYLPTAKNATPKTEVAKLERQ